MGTGVTDCHDQSADWSRNDKFGTFSAVGDGFTVPPYPARPACSAGNLPAMRPAVPCPARL